MKHLTYGEKSLLIDDQTAGLLLEYARLLGSLGGSDTVAVKALGPDGNDVEATFLLNSSTVLMMESATSDFPQMVNEDAVRYLEDRIDELSRPFELGQDPAVEDDQSER